MAHSNRFLGDSPLRVAVKLIVLSFVVGVAMNALGLSPYDVVDWLAYGLRELWATGFEAVRRFGDIMLVGAVIVVPLFLLARLLRYRG